MRDRGAGLEQVGGDAQGARRGVGGEGRCPARCRQSGRSRCARRSRPRARDEQGDTSRSRRLGRIVPGRGDLAAVVDTWCRCSPLAPARHGPHRGRSRRCATWTVEHDDDVSSSLGTGWDLVAYGSPANGVAPDQLRHLGPACRVPPPPPRRQRGADGVGRSGFAWQISVTREAPRMASRPLTTMRTLLMLDLPERSRTRFCPTRSSRRAEHSCGMCRIFRRTATAGGAATGAGIGQRLERLIALVLAARCSPNLAARVACGLDET